MLQICQNGPHLVSTSDVALAHMRCDLQQNAAKRAHCVEQQDSSQGFQATQSLHGWGAERGFNRQALCTLAGRRRGRKGFQAPQALVMQQQDVLHLRGAPQRLVSAPSRCAAARLLPSTPTNNVRHCMLGPLVGPPEASEQKTRYGVMIAPASHVAAKVGLGLGLGQQAMSPRTFRRSASSSSMRASRSIGAAAAAAAPTALLAPPSSAGCAAAPSVAIAASA